MNQIDQYDERLTKLEADLEALGRSLESVVRTLRELHDQTRQEHALLARMEGTLRAASHDAPAVHADRGAVAPPPGQDNDDTKLPAVLTCR